MRCCVDVWCAYYLWIIELSVGVRESNALEDDLQRENERKIIF
jgi:hypothetical protein